MIKNVLLSNWQLGTKQLSFGYESSQRLVRIVRIPSEVREKSILGTLGFRSYLHFFCKNAVLNICRYLTLFYTYKKINNIFLHFDHFFKDAKNHRNQLNLFRRKTQFKNITNAHINRFGPL